MRTLPPLHRPTAALLAWALACVAALLTPGCGGEDPVLKGVPEAPLLGEEAPAAPSTDEERPVARRSANPELYEKPPDIYIDANWIAGRSFREARGVVQQQLGALVDTRELPADRGQELRFERGTLRLLEDRIYYVAVPLPEPTRRDLALADTGFSPPVSKWLGTHRAWRLNNERGFRRIRLIRLDAEGEFVTGVEAWKWIPGEHANRR